MDRSRGWTDYTPSDVFKDNSLAAGDWGAGKATSREPVTAYGRYMPGKATDPNNTCISCNLHLSLLPSRSKVPITTMTNVNTTLTWSLDSTASTTVSVLKDVMRAATSDNVQPLALIACEKFGATLAMCPETNKKMEDLIIKVSGPKYVRFMSAQIGYSAKDSATQLSQSLAGVQFLGLAAALISTMSTFEGADALRVILVASASDKTLVPTARQLKDLLGVMEHRVNRSGFADIWVGYQILLSGGLRALHEQGYCKRPDEVADLMQSPGIDGIFQMVEAFRQLNRLGDATAITIRATSCAPWVMAFTRWCLGLPPSTYLPNGEALLDQPASRMTLLIGNDVENASFEMAVQRSIDSPADLLQSQVSSRIPCGMVTVECFGRNRCLAIGGEESLAYAAMSEGLPYALKQACELLQLFEDPRTAERVARDTRVHHTQPFPEDFIISSILTRVMNTESRRYLKRLDEGQLISDLPLVRQHLRDLAESCACKHCQEQPMPSHERDHRQPTCKQETFLYSISQFAADILALSIFECPDGLLISLDPGRFNNRFANKIKLIIKSDKPTYFSVKEILACALRLVGHKDTDRDWVISCYKGQAVYPRVYETGDIGQPGYLVLYWAPGLLFFEGESYSRGIDRRVGDSIGDGGVPSTTNDISGFDSASMTKQLSYVTDRKLEWKVVRRDGYLEVYPACGKILGRASYILPNLAGTLIIRDCPHDSASPLDRLDLVEKCGDSGLPFEELSSKPGHGMRRLDLGDVEIKFKVWVVAINREAVNGDASLCMLVMSAPDPSRGKRYFDIRTNACLQCCWKCVKNIFSYVH